MIQEGVVQKTERGQQFNRVPKIAALKGLVFG